MVTCMAVGAGFDVAEGAAFTSAAGFHSASRVTSGSVFEHPVKHSADTAIPIAMCRVVMF